MFIAFFGTLWVTSPVWVPILGIFGGLILIVAAFFTMPLWVPIIMIVILANFFFAVASIWRY